MTAPEAPESPAPTDTKKGRSPGVIIAIVIIVVVVLVGGGIAIYKLTKSKDEPTAVIVVAKNTTAAVASGNDATIRSLSTGNGTTQLLALSPDSVNGFTFVARNCAPVQGSEPTRVCTTSRPGGQLTLRLVFVDSEWKVDEATVGPAAVTPTSTTTTP
jgi:hypothetical protein